MLQDNASVCILVWVWFLWTEVYSSWWWQAILQHCCHKFFALISDWYPYNEQWKWQSTHIYGNSTWSSLKIPVAMSYLLCAWQLQWTILACFINLKESSPVSWNLGWKCKSSSYTCASLISQTCIYFLLIGKSLRNDRLRSKSFLIDCTPSIHCKQQLCHFGLLMHVWSYIFSSMLLLNL